MPGPRGLNEIFIPRPWHVEQVTLAPGFPPCLQEQALTIVFLKITQFYLPTTHRTYNIFAQLELGSLSII